jgi:isohexenylglutaconyl-CoA hydratase
MAKVPIVENLLVECRGPRAFVTLNRPEVRNALSAEMVADLSAVVEWLEREREIGAVVLRGAGGVFCAGGDIKGFKASFETPKPKHGKPDPIAVRNRQFGKFLAKFNALPQTVIAVVEGAAIAGGLGLMCAADLVIAIANTEFSLSETRLGIPPAQIAPFVASRIGVAKTRLLALTGMRIDGREAARLGLADLAYDDVAALEAALKKVLADIGRCAPGANAATKRLLLASLTVPREKLLDQAAKAFAAALRGDEGREGVASFLEKRPTRWAQKSTRRKLT